MKGTVQSEHPIVLITGASRGIGRAIAVAAAAAGWSIAICIGIILSAVAPAQAQWTKMQLPRPMYLFDAPSKTWQTLAAVEWADSLTGYVFEYNGVYYKTIDGGSSWKCDSIPMTTRPRLSMEPVLRECDFVNRDFGVVSMRIIDDLPWFGIPEYGIGRDSILYITTDGGESWIERDVAIRNGPSVMRRLQPGTRITPLWNHDLILCGTKDVGLQAYPRYVVFMSRSSDLGVTWKQYAVDSIYMGFEGVTVWLYADSLRAYHCLFSYDMTSINGWTDMTSDGGRTWIRNCPDIPIGEASYRSIHRMNDTGLVVVLGPGYMSSSMHNAAGATRDVRLQNSTSGWIWNSNYSGRRISDIAYIEGWEYLIREDSLFARHSALNEREHAIRLPVADVNGRLFTPTWDRLYYWGGNGLWRFDHNILAVETPPAGRPQSPELEMYPQPLMRGAHQALHVRIPCDVRSTVTVTLCDLLGRVVSSNAFTATDVVNRVLTVPSTRIPSPSIRNGVYLAVVAVDGRTMMTHTLMLN